MDFLLSLGTLALILVFPIKLAGNFCNGGNTDIVPCLIAAVLGPAASVLAYRMSPGNVLGVMLALMAGLGVYAAVLKIPARSMPGFTILVLALQLAVIGALLSFGQGVLRIITF